MSCVIVWTGPASSYFWPRIKILDNGCWLWVGNLHSGYGRFYYHGTEFRAHVWAYTNCIGPVPAGLELDHLCRNRACVNPLHLEPVTTKVNLLRGVSPPAINARKTHCSNGHPLSGDNLCIELNGDRRCIACRCAQKRRSYHARQRLKGSPLHKG